MKLASRQAVELGCVVSERVEMPNRPAVFRQDVPAGLPEISFKPAVKSDRRSDAEVQCR